MYAEGRAVFATARAHLASRPHSERVVGTALHEGSPSQVLLDQSSRAPLCVVGRRGRGRVASYVLGSTSMALAALSRVPLVVVPPDWRPGDDERGPVVLGVDVPPRCHEALGFALDAAHRHAAPLVAVCGWELPGPARSLVGAVRARARPTAAAEWRSALAQARTRHALAPVLTEILAPWQARYPDVTVNAVVEHASPVSALVTHSRDARLLVLGSRPHPGDLETTATLARALLPQVSCPVAIVPDHLPPGRRPDGV
jgi:nucleotide-binding universal stress UspA family protein